MVHQHIHSVHFNGEIVCLDLDSLITALFNTDVDYSEHPAVVSATDEKYPALYCNIILVSHSGTEVACVVTDFRVETIQFKPIVVGKEALISVKFSADLIVPTIPS